jgi:type II secretory ATPase GspE/PulE/Tfp pilus assembly ATPase PilB-like protein
MMSDRLSPRLVSVGLVDGTTRVGRLTRFAPRAADLTLEVGGGGEGERPLRLPLPAERVAFVGFQRLAGRTVLQRIDRDRVVRKVHVPTGRSFVVETSEPSLQDNLGFYAVPTDAASPFEELFFYRHGVDAVEIVALLGAMLVEGGLLTPSALEAGLAQQADRRGAPLGQILIQQKALTPAALDAALALQTRKRGRLGEILVEEGLVKPADVEAALAEQRRRANERLGDILVEMKAISEADLATMLARKFDIPFVDLDERVINPAAMVLVDPRLVSRYGALPIDVDEHSLTVAASEPLAPEVLELLRAQARKQIREVLVATSQLHAHMEQLLEEQVKDSLPGLDRILEQLGGEQGAMESTGAVRAVEVHEDDSAVIKLANQIIMDAYRAGASDIHVEPNGRERGAVIRFRIDGDCVAYREIPPAYRRSLVARIKIMAKLDIAERRKPQDGKIRLIVRHKQIELRVATMPTVDDNEDVVLRILAGSRPMPLDRIGLAERNLSSLRTLAAQPYGMILCVGPTGSGKTTTLHSILGSINNVDTKIWTAEDPVEITQSGLRQVQMNERVGLTFAAALRSFLRSDPDVIMIGEMRDEETARIAVEASLTGHLVFSTLHTNSAPETVTRLLDMGLEPFGFGDALLGVLAQRLARALCAGCREPYQGTREEWDALAAFYGEAALAERLGGGFGPAFKLWRGRGCEACGNTGLKGRIGLHELLVNDDRTRALIQRRAPADEIRRAAMAAGLRTLAQDGVEKALAGLIDVRQIKIVAAR